MISYELRKWADYFGLLRTELNKYDARADEAAQRSPAAAARRGTSQLIAFQLGTAARMSLGSAESVGQVLGGRTMGNEHVLLLRRYMAELTALVAAGADDFEKTRSHLRALTKRFERLARRWASSGVKESESETIFDELMDLLLQIQRGESGEAASFKHPRCYANTRGGCSAKISGEHYVSHGLIRLYHGERAMVTPTWSDVPIPGKAFVANILCTAHNNGLTTADSAALQFARPLKRINEAFDGARGDIGGDEVFQVSGDDFQRWVLKLLINHAVGQKMYAAGEPIDLAIPSRAIDLLLDYAGWADTWGLCVSGMPRHRLLNMDPFTNPVSREKWWEATPLIGHEGQELRGGVVELAGVGFALSLFNQGRDEGCCDDPASPFYQTVQRPRSITWNIRGVEKRMEFTWNDSWAHPDLTATIDI